MGNPRVACGLEWNLPFWGFFLLVLGKGSFLSLWEIPWLWVCNQFSSWSVISWCQAKGQQFPKMQFLSLNILIGFKSGKWSFCLCVWVTSMASLRVCTLIKWLLLICWDMYQEEMQHHPLCNLKTKSRISILFVLIQCSIHISHYKWLICLIAVTYTGYIHIWAHLLIFFSDFIFNSSLSSMNVARDLPQHWDSHSLNISDT